MKQFFSKKYPVSVTLFLCAACSLFCDEGLARKPTGTFTLEIIGLRNDTGLMQIAIFNSRESFLKDGKDFRHMSVPIKNAKAVALIENLPFGNYGIAVFHDENSNGKMDTNFLGIPKEGFGFSNTQRPLGPPKFETAKIVFDGTINKALIAITYY